MFSKSWNQFKNNSLLLIVLNICVAAIFLAVNNIFTIENIIIKYMILNTIIAIPLFFTHKVYLQISSTNTKVKFKELFSKNTVKNIIEISATYLVMSIISVFTTAIILILTLALTAAYFSLTADISEAGPIHYPIAILLLIILPIFTYLKMAFIPLSVLDDSFKEFSLLKRIMLGFKINKWNFEEMVSNFLLLTLLILGGLLFFGIGIIPSIALINIIFSNSYIIAKDTYLQTNIKSLDD